MPESEKTPSERLRGIRPLIEAALLTDGDHHKQWYLYQIADVIGVDIDLRNISDGVAP